MDTLTTVLSPVEEVITQDTLAGYTQHAISSHIDQRNSHLVDTIINAKGDKREMARRRSLTLPYAGAWLHAVPKTALRTKLESMEFALALEFRLGMAIYEEGKDCSLCDLPMDSMGDHGLHCSKGGGWQGRHNGIRDAFAAMAASARRWSGEA